MLSKTETLIFKKRLLKELDQPPQKARYVRGSAMYCACYRSANRDASRQKNFCHINGTSIDLADCASSLPVEVRKHHVGDEKDTPVAV